MDIEIIKTVCGHFRLWNGSTYLADCGKGAEGEERATAIWDEIKNLQLANEAMRHKADQYDSVVEALHVADSGRYRADTLDTVLHRLRRAGKVHAVLARLIYAIAGEQEDPIELERALGYEAAPLIKEARALLIGAQPSRTAIVPFACLYEAARGLVGDDWVVGRVNDATGAVFEVTMGDLKRLVEGANDE
jgi:hypothetical protein